MLLVVETKDRYIAKFNKAITTVTELIVQNDDIDEINRSNDLLEVIINNIRKLTSEILKQVLNDKIKEQDLNVFTTLEFKLIQLRNCLEPYIDMKKTHVSLVGQDNITLLLAQSRLQ